MAVTSDKRKSEERNKRKKESRKRERQTYERERGGRGQLRDILDKSIY